MFLKLFFVVFVLMVDIVAAQEKQTPPNPQPEGTVTDSKTQEPVVEKFPTSGDLIPTPQMVAGSIGPIRCRNGDVFIRPIGPSVGALNSPLIRLSGDGKSSVQFDPNTVPEFLGKELVAPVYAVDRLGRVYFLVRLINPGNHEEEPSFVIAFSADGTYSWKVELDRTLWPYSLAAFSSGDFLISAMDRAPYQKEPGEPTKSFTGIFTKDGRLKRRFDSSEDRALDPSQAAEPKTLQFGDAVTAPDGYVYLLRSDPELRVEIWSETGERIRELKLKPPLKSAQAGNLMVADRTIALRFLEAANKEPRTEGSRRAGMIWAVYDSTTGEALRYYDANSVKGLLACFERDRFTFIVPKSDRMALLRVDVR